MLKKIKKTLLRKLTLLVILSLGLFAFLSAGPLNQKTYAAECHASDGQTNDCSGYPSSSFPDGAIDPNGCYSVIEIRDTATGQIVSYSVAPCDQASGGNESAANAEDRKVVKNDCNGPNIRAGAPPDDENHCAILDYLVTFINALSALVGIVVIIMVILGGIQYAASRDEPQKVKAARSRITSALIALAVYIFMYAFLQWAIPGGAF